MTEKNAERKIQEKFGMTETNTERKLMEGKEIVPGSAAMKFIEMLCPEARHELARRGIVELVSVGIAAVPDPERPEDRLAMKIVTDVYDNFQPGIPAIDRSLDKADVISTSSADDFSLSIPVGSVPRRAP